jgi:hypothetical protein
LLSFIPFIFLLGLLDAEYLAIDEEYHGYWFFSFLFLFLFFVFIFRWLV